MNSLDLIIRHGTALLHNIDPSAPGGSWRREVCDIGIKQGRIAEITSSITTLAAQEIDAKGLMVLPGVIDSQVHFREPGMTHKEDLESGTRAALLGGVTAVFEMPNTMPPTLHKQDLLDKLARAKGRSHTHYAFYAGASDTNVQELTDLEKHPHCPGIKVFMGSSTGNLLVESDEVLERVFLHTQKRVVLHSEDEHRLRERKSIATDSKDVHQHPVWRDVDTAVSSTRRLLRLARKHNRRVHVLHVSTAEEMEILRHEKDIATVEVLPNHLTLWAPECYDRLGTYAQQNPPIRDKRHWEALWKGVQDGTADIIGSDHAPHTREEKDRPYPQSPSGTPGVQTLIPIMLNHVHEGRLSLERFVEMVTESPRRIFGIKNKGRIALGFDADFTLVDLKKKRRIENKWIASRCGWTPFDGLEVTGWPTHTIIAGRLAMQDDEILVSPLGRPLDFE